MPDEKLEDKVEGDFYGVSGEYLNYANETDKPIWTDEEKELLGLDKEGKKKETGSKEPVDARVTDDPKLTTPAQPAPPTAK